MFRQAPTSQALEPVRHLQWSRRQFLALTGTTALGALAAACGSPTSAATNGGPGTASYRSRPDLHPTLIDAKVVGKPAPGYVLVTAGDPMIVDNRGEPLWIQPVPAASTNLQVQQYRGRPVLTWWQGEISPYGVGLDGECLLLDTSYQVVARVSGGNGLHPDLHEFVLTDQGTAYMTAYAPVERDLTPAQGPRRGTMLDSIVQEVDVATGEVLFEWHGAEHIAVDESYALDQGKYPYDPYHLNSIQVTPDGNLLVSARNTWTLYKVDRSTGAILWRLGGKLSDFTLGDGVRFAWQHHARQHPGGTITVFDDEAAPPEGPRSRGLVLHVDESTMRADLAHAYVHPGANVLAGSQGSVELLPGGHVFVGWGAEPYYSEFQADGSLVLDAKFGKGQSYRAFRSAWTGRPGGRPDVAAERSGGRVTVFASWNGATEISAWEVWAGSGPGSMAKVARSKRTGFETSVVVDGSSTHFAAQALDAAGTALGMSKIVRA